MDNCKDCKHWGVPDAKFAQVFPYGLCHKILRTDHCKGMTAFIEDDNNELFVGLRTLPDFGCVLFVQCEE